MREQVEKVELLSLEKVNPDRWRFRITWNESFVQMFESMMQTKAFEASFSGTYYKINNEGMWLLSHCFSNWEEMYAKVGKEAKPKEPEKKCADCGGTLYPKSLAGKVHCQNCNKTVCIHCWENHWRTHTNTAYRCSGCNRIETVSPGYTSPYQECSHCHEYFCDSCWSGHIHIDYSARREYGFGSENDFSWDVLFRFYSMGAINAEEFKKYTSQRAQAEEAKEREREEAERFYHWSYNISEEESDVLKSHYKNFRPHTSQTRTKQASSTQTKLPTTVHEAFSILELPMEATTEQIQKAFRAKAQIMHPDKPTGSEDAFKRLNAAYQIALRYAK